MAGGGQRRHDGEGGMAGEHQGVPAHLLVASVGPVVARG
jgi:hypothetical protein